jgi:hypothetical protein
MDMILEKWEIEVHVSLIWDKLTVSLIIYLTFENVLYNDEIQYNNEVIRDQSLTIVTYPVYVVNN